MSRARNHPQQGAEGLSRGKGLCSLTGFRLNMRQFRCPVDETVTVYDWSDETTKWIMCYRSRYHKKSDMLVVLNSLETAGNALIVLAGNQPPLCTGMFGVEHTSRRAKTLARPRPYGCSVNMHQLRLLETFGVMVHTIECYFVHIWYLIICMNKHPAP